MTTFDQLRVLSRWATAKALAPTRRRRYTLAAYDQRRAKLDGLLADEARRIARTGDEAYPGHLDLRRAIVVSATTALDIYARTPAATAAYPEAGEQLRTIIAGHRTAVDDGDHQVPLEDVAYAIGIRVAATSDAAGMTELGGRCAGAHRERQREALRRYHRLDRQLAIAESDTDRRPPARRLRLARRLVNTVRDTSNLTGGVPLATAERAATVYLAYLNVPDRAAGADATTPRSGPLR